MSRLLDIAREAAEARADAVRARVRSRLVRLLPGARVREHGDRIEISGPDLVRRWLLREDLRDWRDEVER